MQRLEAGLLRGSAPPQQLPFFPLGAGGFNTGIAIAPDGTTLVRTDTYGFYKISGGAAQLLYLGSQFPAPTNGRGCWEIAIAPSQTTRFAAICSNILYRSDNGGATWAAANLTMTNANANDGTGVRLASRKMAIDPANPDHAIVGMPNGSAPSGVWETFNFGAATPTWAKISGIADPTVALGVTGIIFDTSSGTTTVSGHTVTARCLVASNGNGLYETLNGGSTWTLTTGTPTQIATAQMGPAGQYYCAGGTASGMGVMRYLPAGNPQAGWADISPNAHYFAASTGPCAATTCADPAISGKLLVSGPNAIFLGFQTTNADAATVTWVGNSGFPSGKSPVLTGPIGWMNQVKGASVGNMIVNPVDGFIYGASGIGTWKFTNINYSFSYNVAATTVCVGMEQMVANDSCSPVGAAQPLFGVWDRGIMRANLPGYPTAQYPTPALTNCWQFDYASDDPAVIVALIMTSMVNNSAVSIDSGVTFNQLGGTLPTTTNDGGCVAVASSTNFLMAIGGNSGSRLYYTKDGTTYNLPPGLPQGPTNKWTAGNSTPSRVVAADRVNIGTFIAYNQGNGIYKSTDGGDTWALQSGSNLANGGNFRNTFWFAPGTSDLWFSEADSNVNSLLYKSTDWGATKSTIANVSHVIRFGFGKPAPGSSYPTIILYGSVNGVVGFWFSTDGAVSWTKVAGTLVSTPPLYSLDFVNSVNGDMNIFGRFYVGFGGSSFAYFG